jgi:tetratricopeptide (TPR) repeat protein
MQITDPIRLAICQPAAPAVPVLVCGWLLLPVLAISQARMPVVTPVATPAMAKATRPAAKSVVAQRVDTPKTEAQPDAALARVVDARILPLFGERSKTGQQIEDEIRFLNDCDQNFASRHEASRFFAARGWEYISEAQLDTAAYRFNLAHLLNEKNADALWGLGVVCYQRNRLPDAIRMLKLGATLADTNAVLFNDLATVELELFQTRHDTTSLTDARDHLQRAVFLNPAQATAYARLSQISYYMADYRSAWTYLHKAYKLDLSCIDLPYVQELLAKEADPVGLFR